MLVFLWNVKIEQKFAATELVPHGIIMWKLKWNFEDVEMYDFTSKRGGEKEREILRMLHYYCMWTVWEDLISQDFKWIF